MKINISPYGNSVDGYTNHEDPTLNDVENGSAEEILSDCVITMFTPDQVMHALSQWVDKLQPNGTLIVNFVDVRRVCRMMYTGEIDMQNFHEQVFGGDGRNRSVIDANVLRNACEYLPITVDYLGFNGSVGSVRFKKNGN